MKILFIAENLNKTDGWGTYAAGLTGALKEERVCVVTECVTGPLRFKRNFFFGPLIAIRLWWKYRKEGIELIHCTIEPHAFFTVLLAKLLRVPCIITVHGTYAVYFFHHPIYSFLQAWAYRQAVRVIAVSRYTEKRLLEHVALKNTLVIPNGVYKEPISAPRELSGRKTILGVGAVKRRKGYHLVIEALGKIKDTLGSFSYTIVGSLTDEVYVGELRKRIGELGLTKHVILTGRLSDEALGGLYEQSDAFILTPVSEGFRFEGFGLVYLEANAYGLPVIAMKGSGAEEAVKNGHSGYLAESGNITDLADNILALVTDNQRYSKLSAGALQWSQEMNWRNIAKRYISAYSQFLDKLYD